MANDLSHWGDAPSAAPTPGGDLSHWGDVPDALPAVSPWESSKAGRFVQGLKEPIYGAGQLAAHLTGLGAETMDKEVAELERRYQASRAAAGIGKQDWDYAAGLGNIASPINYIPGAAVGRLLGAAGRGATLASRLGEGVASGAAQGAFTPVADTSGGDFAEQKARQAGVGAAAGSAGAALGPGIRRAIAPGLAPGVEQTLANVELTPGQRAGGFLKKAEDALATISPSIQEARTRSFESFDRVAGNRALAHINEHLPANVRTGHEIATELTDRLGNEYNRIHSATSLGMDPQLQNDLQAVGRRYRTLGPERLQQLQEFIDQNIEEPLRDHGGIAPGQAVHTGMANLRRMAGTLSTDRDGFTRELGAALEDVHDAANAALERQNPGFRQALQRANAGYADFVRIRHAASSRGAKDYEGTFMPSQLSSAARAMDRSAGKGDFARKRALMQDLAGAGQSAMPSKMPSSGTAERAAALALLGGHLAISPSTAVIHALLPALYSRRGVQLANAALAARMPAPVTALMPRAAASGALSATDTTRRRSPVDEQIARGQQFVKTAMGQ